MSETTRRAEPEFGRLADLTLDAFCVAGFDGYLKLVNPAFSHMLGYTEDELLSRPFLDIVHPDDRERVQGAMGALDHGDEVRGFACRQLHADGSIRWVEWNSHARRDEGVVYAVGRDVTDRHRMNEAVQRLADEQAALRRVATFVAAQAPPDDIHAAVAEEVALLLAAHRCAVGRIEPDEMLTVTGYWSMDGTDLPVGTQIPLEGDVVTDTIRRSVGPIRIETFDDLSGPVVDYAREVGPLPPSTVGAPIVVDGQVWGVIFVSSMTDPLPDNAESRVVLFTELVATAISNAEAHRIRQRLADEQAALRRVATLVARDAASTDVLEAVATEVGNLLDSEITVVARYDDDGGATAIGSWSASGVGMPVGTRAAIGGRNLLTTVATTRKPARIDSYDDATGETAEIARRYGWRSSIAAPIIVEDRLWGLMYAAAPRQEAFPAGAELRLAAFTDLVATAIANAESREALSQLATEQVALQRVATLVAESPDSENFFSAVAREVAAVLDVPGVILDRFEPDGSQVTIGSAYDLGLAGADSFLGVGVRLQLHPGTLAAAVLESERAARVDDYSQLQGTMGDAARAAGIGSGCAAPIVVDGRLWGQMCVFSAEATVLPAGTEHRLDDFVKLVATAISNHDARGRSRRLAEEQAALRRVATLVAEGVTPSEIFEAVSKEVQGVLHLDAATTDVATVVRFDPGPECVLVGMSKPIEENPLGDRWEPHDVYVSTRVLRSGKSSRVEAQDLAVDGPEAAKMRRQGYLSQVASPIIVGGRLWGAMTASSVEPLPIDTEDRLENFIELVATAIANAESRGALAKVVDEQTALRRVATLVAQRVSAPELFSAVSEEVDHLFGTTMAAVGRFDHDDPAVVIVGAGERTRARVAIGSRVPLDDALVATHVYRTRRSARVGRLDTTSGVPPAAEVLDLANRVSSVASPIVVDGRLWGVITVTSESEVLPPDTQERLEKFTELVATAISNAESREHIHRLAEEQAALRRVATLVAGGIATEDVFAAVASEVGHLFGSDVSAIVRFEDAGVVTVLGDIGGPHMAGARVVLDPGYVVDQVRVTSASARYDTDDPSAPDAPSIVRSLGIRSALASPIVVEGELWGAITAASRDSSLGSHAEQRLNEFTELVATAIANAESRAALAQLVDEQTALRRLATLVAEGVSSGDLFSALTKEVAQAFSDGDATLVASVIRFDPGPESVLVGASRAYAHEPLGSRWAPKELYVSTRVLRTGRPARVDEADLDEVGGPDADLLRLREFLYQVGSPVVVEGELWGAMCLNSSRELPPDTDVRLASFVELIATAIANAESRSELAASRRRIVAASDEARRRIERDLHDGTQQRLVSLALVARSAEAELPPESSVVREKLATIASGLGDAVADLQELSRGIHPAILSDAGLPPALEALALRSPIPVELDVRTRKRFPEQVEVGAYFVASESLANAAKHSEASRIEVLLAVEDERLLLAVRDDGIGGADPGRGSGLVGVRDRVEALGGTITIESHAGAGTSLTVRLPLVDEPSSEGLLDS